MATSTISCADARDMVAAVAYRLGFQPTDSVVVCSVRSDRRLGVVARVDLDATPDAAAHLAQVLLRDLASHVLLVTYTDDEVTAGRAESTIARAVSPSDVTAFRVTSTGYRDARHERAEERPLQDLQSSVIAATAVAAGIALQSQRADLTLVPAGEMDRNAVEDATALAPEMTPADALTAWSAYVGQPDDDPTTIAALAKSLVNPRVRDAVLLLAIESGHEVATLAAHGLAEDQVGRAVSRLFNGHAEPGDVAAAWNEALVATSTSSDTGCR